MPPKKQGESNPFLSDDYKALAGDALSKVPSDDDPKLLAELAALGLSGDAADGDMAGLGDGDDDVENEVLALLGEKPKHKMQSPQKQTAAATATSPVKQAE